MLHLMSKIDERTQKAEKSERFTQIDRGFMKIIET
jgi:hypothetical protein